ncbi:uncharacterized protein DS421_3g89750 [Arachis hypogaea]|nr:uncharacterized protein DS421_3g89750 [Arachis hypogaea]
MRQTGSSKLTNNGGIQLTALRSASPHDEDDVEKTRMDGQRRRCGGDDDGRPRARSTLYLSLPATKHHLADEKSSVTAEAMIAVAAG